MGRLLVLLMVAGVVCIGAMVHPGRASAETFGADLNLVAPDVSAECPMGYPYLGVMMAVGSPTCTWTHYDYRNNTGLISPISGTVRSVSIRQGPRTGPLRIVVMRWLVQNATNGDLNRVCCVITAASPVFTPEPNRMTTITTALPVVHEVLPRPGETRIAAQDMIGVTGMGPDAVIPLARTGLSGGMLIDYLLYPGGTEPAQTPYDMRMTNDFIVPISAEVTADGGAPPLTPGPIGGNPDPGGVLPPLAPATLVLPRAGAQVDPLNRVPLRLACPAGAPCRGLVQLLNRAPVVAAATAHAYGSHALTKRTPPPVLLGKARYTVRAGARALIRVRLNAVGTRLVRARPSARVWVAIGMPGTRARTMRITLRRAAER
ncbi:MAG TPA: hypothetical protein PKE32_06290 [Miltoncostaeaceae bacterium]|nr:hypothetical protein [Miltoncostaeaceae bacterium]